MGRGRGKGVRGGGGHTEEEEARERARDKQRSTVHYFFVVTVLKGKKIWSRDWTGLDRAQNLCKSRGGRPKLPVPNKSLRSLWTESNTELELSHSELRSRVKVEVAVLGSPFLISLMVSVDVKHYKRKRRHWTFDRSVNPFGHSGVALR